MPLRYNASARFRYTLKPVWRTANNDCNCWLAKGIAFGFTAPHPVMKATQKQAPKSDLVGELNTAQKQAVTSTSPHLLILAGAGTGKTRTLIHRIAWKLDSDPNGSRQAMAVTFTNKAAKELKTRLSQLLTDDIAKQRVRAGTFHGIAHQQLRQFGTRIGLPSNFTIIDGEDQKRLVRQLMRQEGVNEQHYPPNEFVSWINRYKEKAVRAKDIDDEEHSVYKDLARIYEKHCLKEGLVDFGELLLASCEMLETCPDVRDYYRDRYSSLFVDEFQDTNAIQYRWFKLLVGAHTGTTLVGDDDQAIYGWRGARMQNMEDYLREFKAEVVRMEENYRSTRTILKAANQVISRNRNRMGKSLFSNAEEGERVRIYAACNDIDEARFTAQVAEDWHAQGNSLSGVAILYRSNALSRVLEEEMVRMRIPYRIYGGVRFYGRTEVKDALSWLQLVEDPNNDIAFVRAIRSPRRGVGDAAIARIQEMANGGPLWQGMTQFAETTARGAKGIGEFINILTHLRQYAGKARLDQLIAEINKTTGLEQMYANKSEGGVSRQENLEELVRASGHFEQRFKHMTPEDEQTSVLEQFLAETSLDAGDEQADGYADAINLMTIHASKGLEFPVVIIVGMEEELMPHVKALGDNSLEEERRLCYVGMTRGIKKLYLSWSAARRMHGRTENRRPSRFLKELPQELVLEVEGSLPSQGSPAYVQDSASEIIGNGNGNGRVMANGSNSNGNGAGMRTGEVVVHRVFGEGTIVSSEGHGDDMRLRVNFVNHGTKLLLASRAGLTTSR